MIHYAAEVLSFSLGVSIEFDAPWLPWDIHNGRDDNAVFCPTDRPTFQRLELTSYSTVIAPVIKIDEFAFTS
jgi:hypothetical protein